MTRKELIKNLRYRVGPKSTISLESRFYYDNRTLKPSRITYCGFIHIDYIMVANALYASSWQELYDTLIPQLKGV